MWLPITSICIQHLLLLPSILSRYNKYKHHQYTIFDVLSTDQKDIDEHHMNLALQQAQKAYQLGEVPIGAIVTIPEYSDSNFDDNDDENEGKIKFRITGNAHNLVETNRDASSHAEMLAMRFAARHPSTKNWRLLNATLYSTLEPCPMCLAAAQAFRIHRIVYAAPDLRLGAVETHMKLLEVAKHPYHDQMQVDRIGGACEEKSAKLMRDFFRERRQKKKTARRSKTNRSSSRNMTLIIKREPTLA